MPADQTQATSANTRCAAAAVIVYVAVALGVDALVSLGVDWPFDWGVFRWNGLVAGRWLRALGLDTLARFWSHGPLRSFDLFKFLFWFVVPFAWSLRRMDWGWFSFKRWKRIDLAAFTVLAVAGIVAVLLVPLFPSLRAIFPSMRGMGWSALVLQLVWVVSWLTGWEFLHRYFLLRPVSARWPRWGWLLVPLSETVYHLLQPWPMTLGMAALSVVLTQWSLRRANVLLPFLVHLVIEVALIAFLFLV